MQIWQATASIGRRRPRTCERRRGEWRAPRRPAKWSGNRVDICGTLRCRICRVPFAGIAAEETERKWVAAATWAWKSITHRKHVEPVATFVHERRHNDVVVLVELEWLVLGHLALGANDFGGHEPLIPRQREVEDQLHAGHLQELAPVAGVALDAVHQRLVNDLAGYVDHDHAVVERRHGGDVEHGHIAARHGRSDAAALHERHSGVRPADVAGVPLQIHVDHRVRYQIAEVALSRSAPLALQEHLREAHAIIRERIDARAEAFQHFQHFRVLRIRCVQQNRLAGERKQVPLIVELQSVPKQKPMRKPRSAKRKM